MFILNTERAQGIVEYALLILLVSLVVILALTALGIDIGNIFSDVETAFPT